MSIDTYSLFIHVVKLLSSISCMNRRKRNTRSKAKCTCLWVYYLSTPACLWSAANSSISDSRERSASVISADSSKTNGDIFPNMNLWLTLFKIWSGFVKLSEKIHNNMNIFFENFSASYYLFLSLKEHP